MIKLNIPPLIQELALGHYRGNPPDPLRDALLELEMPVSAAHIIAVIGHKADHCRLIDVLVKGEDWVGGWEDIEMGKEVHRWKV